ncbi:MAG: hypothetical protein COA62_07440 [Rhodobiaceae bacterium]|nr:MAG: hypothetical protein COA62_07440 [Rhodobiaceae bacterium]
MAVEKKGMLMGIVGNLRRWAVVAMSVAILSACGPVIETHYDYLPPESNLGMRCLAGCQDGLAQCRHTEAVATEECRYREEGRVEDEYELAREKYYRELELYAASPDKFSKPSEVSKGYPSYYRCDNQASQCQPNFNMCYRACGGQVRESQVCVANCDG